MWKSVDAKSVLMNNGVRNISATKLHAIHQSRRLMCLMHVLCVLFAIAELTLLTVFSSIYGKAIHIVGFSVFGSCLVLFYLFRTLYYINHRCAIKGPFFKKIDHLMLYILLGAIYTPVPLLLTDRAMGWSIFGVAWGVVLICLLLELFCSIGVKWITLFLYSAFLILDAVAFSSVHAFLTEQAFTWFFVGGIAYMSATILTVFRPNITLLRYFHTHENLVLFLIAFGSFAHFWALLRYVLLVH